MAAIAAPKLSDMIVKMAIQSRTSTQDPFGHQVAIWVDFVNPIWAAVEDMVFPQILQAFTATIPTQRFMIKMRYRPGVTKDMRLLSLSDNRIYQINDINQIGARKEWLSFRCTELK